MAKKRGGHAGGGHGWFVTFADLMGLLLSYFVMLVAFSSQDKAQLSIMAGSIREAVGQQRERREASVVEIDGIPIRDYLKDVSPEFHESDVAFSAQDHNLDKAQGPA